MADLNVQPKRNTSWWIWLLLALIAIALLIYFYSKRNNAVTNTTNTAQVDSSTSNNTAVDTSARNGEWGDIDFNSPTANYGEITDKDITVRGNDQYAIYSLGDNILFDVDKSTIRKDADAKLKQIAASLTQRYNNGNIRIYGHTDSTGDATHNQQLAEQRADAVKNWLVQNAGITNDHVSIHPLGESQPLASNATEQGSQQNRSVQIVARKP